MVSLILYAVTLTNRFLMMPLHRTEMQQVSKKACLPCFGRRNATRLLHTNLTLAVNTLSQVEGLSLHLHIFPPMPFWYNRSGLVVIVQDPSVDTNVSTFVYE